MKKRVLILAKTEPSPSKKYGSTVCTAGITDEGEFIRLYPIPYRLFCGDGGFSKYDWIEVECEKNPDDGRPESYKINSDTITHIRHVDTDFNWAERNDVILPHVSKNIKELEVKGVSLGIIRPQTVIDLVKSNKEDGVPDSAKEYRKTLQMIFDEEAKLKKIPLIEPLSKYFRYRFRCEGEESDHNLMCEDWEIYQSLRSWIEVYGSEEAAWEKMYEKFMTKFTKEKDLCFFVGTHYLWKTWIIIGLYYPPKVSGRQTKLFSL